MRGPMWQLVLASVSACAMANIGQPPKAYFWSIPADSNPLAGSATLKYALLEPVGVMLPRSIGQTLAPCETPLPTDADRWSTPEEDARRIRCKVLNQYAGKIDPNDYALILQNFAIDNTELGDSPTSLLRQADAVDVDIVGTPDADWPDGVSGFDDGDLSRARRQPWMVTGRTLVKDWMNRFLTEYNNDTPLPPPPARFHFDSEEILIGTKRNYVFLVQQLEADAQGAACSTDPNQVTRRWGCEIVPGTGTTMAALWGAAQQLHGQGGPVQPWNQNLLSSSVHHTFNGAARDFTQIQPGLYNREIYLWYYDLMQRVLDASMTEVAYDPIKLRFPNAKVSDYADTFLLPGDVSYGWHMRPGLSTPCPIPTVLASDPLWSREGVRGWHDQRLYGNRLEPQSSASEHGLFWRVLTDHRASGDFSSPHMYPIGKSPTGTDDCSKSGSWTRFEQRSPYLRGHPLEGARWTTSLRHHRWWVESIISSYESTTQIREPWQKIAPWVALPGCNPDDPFKKIGYTVTLFDTIAQLALLRQKAIPEMIVWDNFAKKIPGGNLPNPEIGQAIGKFREQYERVYAPQLVSASRIGGLQDPFPACDANPLERLNDTNRRANCEQTSPPYTFGDYAFPVTSTTTGPKPSASLIATFSGFSPEPGTWENPTLTPTIRLHLEAIVDVPTAAAGSLRGRLQVWRWPKHGIPGSWVDAYVEDSCDPGTFTCTAGDPREIEAFAPAWVVDGISRREIRRRFDLNVQHIAGVQQFINGMGQLRVRYTFLANQPFVAHFDLVQAHTLNAPEIETVPPDVRPAWVRPVIPDDAPSQPAGLMADINYTGVVDAGDLIDFADAFATGQTIADYNLDNAIDPADMDAFLNDYTGGN